MPGNPNSPLICGEGKSLGRNISEVGLYHVYNRYKEVMFPKLLENPNVSPEDKQKIRNLLRKPRNPYVVGRHATLTQKSRVLKEATLRVFAGWTADSDSPFINKVAELTVKVCQGAGGRALDGKSSRVAVVREILEQRRDRWDSWDSITRQSHWWTMSNVFYAARKRLVEEEGYTDDDIDRDYITGLIKDICENHLHRKREDIGIIAADRAQLYFKGQWMDVGFNEIRELSLYGTDLIIIEKEGMAIQFKEFADEYGIAILNPRGFLVEYASILSEKSELEGCNISILTDLDASGLVLARAVPNAFRIGIDFDTLEDLGLELEKVEESYKPGTHLNPLQDGKYEGVYPDDIVDYVTDKRVEINSVIVQLDDNRRFWDWILDKLREQFPDRNYNRSVNTTNQDIVPTCLEELNNVVKEEDAVILEPHTDKLHGRLSNIKDGFLFDPTNKVLSNGGKDGITIPQ